VTPTSADPVSGDQLDDWSDVEEGESGPAAVTPGLDERSREILAFERRWWRHAGAKEQAVRDTFGLSSTRYYQLLNAVLDDPAGLAHDPVLVGRLRRLRAWRNRSRAVRG
jgi:hypothetical protein